MSNILNTRASSYYFIFPRGFFPDRVKKKYEEYIKKQPIPYDNIQDFLNSTIQSITMPSLTAGTVEQVRKLGKIIKYKNSMPVQDAFNKEFSISFRVVDGFINYWAFMETVLYFLNFKNEQLFIQELPLRLLDNQGNIMISIKFSEVLILGFSELEMNATQYDPQDTSFTINFSANYLDIDLEFDRDHK